tara:strand:- start:165 stop:506 length:342 start_codon:yes stop_codon:yes gene_type:complete
MESSLIFALWISWFCLLFAIIIAYTLLMDKDAWRVHFVEMSATGEEQPTPWHKSRKMLTVIQALLAFSAFFLLMHFVLPRHDGGNTPIDTLPPINNTRANSTATRNHKLADKY